MVVSVTDDGSTGGQGSFNGFARMLLDKCVEQSFHVQGLSRCFPTIGAEQEVDDMVVHLGITLQVAVDHLPDRRCSVLKESVSPSLETEMASRGLTWEPHDLDAFPALRQPLLQQLYLCCLATPIQPFKYDESAPWDTLVRCCGSHDVCLSS
jgi:hypothetical protein